MKTVILGAGAMGSMFGGCLGAIGEDVTLVDINESHVSAIRENGLKIDRGDGPQYVSVKATSDPNAVEPADVVIVFCKFLSTEVALKSARPYITDATILWTLQNGIGNIDIMKNFAPDERLVKGLTSATGIINGPGSVSTNFQGETETFFQPLNGQVDNIMNKLADKLSEAGLPTAYTDDIDYRIWRKLVINATLTVLSGAMNTQIGAVYFNPAGKELCLSIAKEVVDVAQAAGVSLTLDDALDYLDKLANSAVDHIGSTTISLQLHEKTEIDSMNGAVVREGLKHGVPTPVNKVIFDLIKLVEQSANERLSPAI